MKAFKACTVLLLLYLNQSRCDSVDDLSTIEPVFDVSLLEASTGCRAPDLRFTRPRKTETTTVPPYVEFKTTQIYLPEDFTTADIQIINKIDNIHSSSSPLEPKDDKNPKYADINPYGFESEATNESVQALDTDDIPESHTTSSLQNANGRRRGKKRRFTGGKRRRVENEHGGNQGRGMRGNRYERHLLFKREIKENHEKNNQQELLVGKIVYIESADLLNTNVLNGMMKHSNDKMAANPNILTKENKKDNKRKLIETLYPEKSYEEANERIMINDTTRIDEKRYLNAGNISEEDQSILRRIKRKSGKTTGALSRPKAGGDTGAKSTSRKGDKGGYDEEGGYIPFHPDDDSLEEDSKENDSSEGGHFGDVTEIRFPGEVGPLGDRRLCKIRCVKGKWVGPLCATNEEDDHGNIKFQPLYKSCHVNRMPPHLLLSYRNISVNVGWDLPHGHSLQARCKDLGLYKLLGESRVLCSNGLWAPRMPSCVPTTLLTNYSDDSPPSIRIKIGSGSGAFEPSGVLAVLPTSTIHLDCMYPRRRGTPEWTWTGWFNQANPAGWSVVPDEKATKYRLTIKDIQNQDSGTYTCASPRGLTNSIVIVVATSQCPQITNPTPPLSLRLEGNKLGQRAQYICPLGYTIEGTTNSTCLASGNWSSPPPTCNPVQCPQLFLEDSHLSLIELNTSAWGRAVFKCSWGFRLSGPPGLECEPSGVWSGPVPRCRAIQCPQPLVPINGRIDGTSGSSSHRRYAVGALVTFSCTEGHLLVGEASIVCTETGFWSHPPPFCKSQCPYPGDPPNGLIAPLKFHYDPGDVLSVQCRPGFVEYGATGVPDRPKCLPDGNWSAPVPQCRSYVEV